MYCSSFVVVYQLFFVLNFLEAGRVNLVNGTSSCKFGDDFEIDIVADCVRASMNEKRLRVGCTLGRIIQLSRAYKGIRLFLNEEQTP